MDYYRLHFKLVDENKNLLPDNYQEELMNWVNRFLERKAPMYSKKFHPGRKPKETPYFKPLRVSDFLIPYSFYEQENIRILKDEIYMILVFEEEQMLISYLANIFKNQHIRLGNDKHYVYLKVKRVEHLKLKSRLSAIALSN